MYAELSLSAVQQYLVDLSQSRFWGDLTIAFQDGKPTVIRRNETLKSIPPSKGMNPTYESHR